MERLSKKITVLSFLAMICVVTIHSQTVAALANPAVWNVALQRLLGSTLTCWAVPFFFMVSGFFYVKTLAKLNGESKWRDFAIKKWNGLVVPYLLWVIIGTALSMPICMGANVVAHRPIFTNTVLADGFGWEFVNSFFGIHGAPMGNFPLWYVRSLILLFMLSPLWVVFNRLPKSVRIVLALIISLYDSHIGIPIINVMLGSTGYFIIGMVLAEVDEDKLKLNAIVGVVAGIFASVIAVIRILDVLEPSVFTHVYEFMPYALIVFFWWSYDVVVGEREFKSQFVKQTFWVYCLHNAFVQIVPILAMVVFGKNDVAAVLSFIASPPITIFVCIAAAKIVYSKTPKLYNLLCGGRG